MANIYQADKVTILQPYSDATTMTMPISLRPASSLLCTALLYIAGTSFAHADIAPVSAAQCAAMKVGNTMTASNPVPCSRLATVTFDYMDFEGQARSGGSVVVLDAVAPQVEALFGELLLRSIPIAGAKPLEHFNGDDERSMAANNTSAFNGRPMTGGGGWSKHAYGAAIDINPLQNPYVSQAGSPKQQVLPAASAPDYLARASIRPGMAEDVVGVFYDHGFLIWGGNWKQPIDYQHFEIGSRSFIKKLVALPPQQARAEFERYAVRYRACVHQGEQASAGAAKGADTQDDDAPENTALRDSCAARLKK